MRGFGLTLSVIACAFTAAAVQACTTERELGTDASTTDSGAQACPTSPPANAPCTTEGQECFYPNGCGGGIKALCLRVSPGGLQWSSSNDPLCHSDAGADSDADAAATTYAPDEFESWRWRWAGTGSSGSFAMDRDCGISAEGTLSYYGGPPPGAGVVADDECLAFKTLAVSPEVTAAFAKYGDTGAWCAPITDDYTTALLTVRDGGTHGVSWAGGCSDVEPFKKLRTEMTRLGDKYIVPAVDAGTGGD